jgi:hypothetical protein
MLGAVAIVLIVATRSLAQTRPSEPPPPSMDELRRMFDARQYQDVVRHAVRVLALKGESAAQYDRHEMLVLKAESHLRLGDAEPAAKAFDDAAAAAKDEHAAALDRATALLARRSRQNIYKSKTTSSTLGAGERLSLLDPVGRKLALRALYEDERAASQKRLEVPPRASMNDLLAALDVAVPLRALELGATGASGEVDGLITPLCTRAHELMRDEVKSMSSRVDKLDKAANKKKKMGSAYRKRGLSAEEQGELRDVARACEQVGLAARQFADVAPANAERFTALRGDAQALHERATRVLNTDYTIIYDRD